MLFHLFTLAVLALAPFVGGPTLTADEYTQDGKFVSIADSKLVITCKDGKEQTFTLATNAHVRCDGRTCKCDEIKPGMKVRISTKPEDKQVVTRIEALDKQGAFDGTHDGKLVSITETKLVMTGKNGKEHSHMLSAYAKLTCDGQPCKWDELKPGTKIRVTTKSEETQAVVRIEAIAKQEVFDGTLDGKFVRFIENKMVITNIAGKDQTLNLSSNVKVTCDGQACKVEDLKAGWRIRITTMSDDNQLAIRIEAIDKQDSFDAVN